MGGPLARQSLGHPSEGMEWLCLFAMGARRMARLTSPMGKTVFDCQSGRQGSDLLGLGRILQTDGPCLCDARGANRLGERPLDRFGFGVVGPADAEEMAGVPKDAFVRGISFGADLFAMGLGGAVAQTTESAASAGSTMGHGFVKAN